MNIFKKIKLFKDFKKIIDNQSVDLSEKFNIRVDKSHRLYTVLNIPEEVIGDAYSVKKTDIDRISQRYIKEFLKEVNKDLVSYGLNELFKIYDVKKVSKFSYLIVIGFSLFKSNRYYNYIKFLIIPLLVIILTLLFFTI